MDFSQRFKKKYQISPDAYGQDPVLGLKKAVSYIPGNKVLDLGVGSGRNTTYLIQQELQVTGVDSSKEGLEILQNRIDSKNLSLIEQDVLEYPFDDKFDLVISVGLMHFLKSEESDYLFNKMQNATSSGGVNFIIVKMSQNKRGDLPNVFEPNQLKNIYTDKQWKILEYQEVQTEYKKIARIIAQKV